MKVLRKVLGCTGTLAAALMIGMTSASLHETSRALAQPQPGKYRGSSAYWVPDYVGTIKIRSSGDQAYAAIADVELQQKPTNIYDSNPTAFQYEMRGSITVTTPYVISRSGKVFATCTTASPVPVSIADSLMSIYTNDEQMPKNSYEFIVSQFIRLPRCIDANGRSIQQEYETMEVRFNTSDQPAQVGGVVNRSVTLSPTEQAELDRVTQTGQAMADDPRLQQELEKMIAQDESTFRRTGRQPSAEEILARVERLRRQGILPDEDKTPALSPELERKLNSAYKADYSHLRRFTNINHLKDEMTVNHGSVVLNVSWDLRRVNAR
jgi:hypothetical protein